MADIVDDIQAYVMSNKDGLCGAVYHSNHSPLIECSGTIYPGVGLDL